MRYRARHPQRQTLVSTWQRAETYARQRGRATSAGTLALAMQGLFTHHNPRSIDRMVLINAGFTPRQARQLLRKARREEFADVAW